MCSTPRAVASTTFGPISSRSTMATVSPAARALSMSRALGAWIAGAPALRRSAIRVSARSFARRSRRATNRAATFARSASCLTSAMEPSISVSTISPDSFYRGLRADAPLGAVTDRASAITERRHPSRRASRVRHRRGVPSFGALAGVPWASFGCSYPGRSGRQPGGMRRAPGEDHGRKERLQTPSFCRRQRASLRFRTSAHSPAPAARASRPPCIRTG